MASEVERSLLAHPHVQHAAALGLPDARLGERVVAFVMLRGAAVGRGVGGGGGGGVVDGEGLREFCRGRLAGYKVPKEVRVVDALPMTASGKVMKARLKRRVFGEGERQGQQGQGQQGQGRRSFL
jgi:fatty-acyl-CoA synthase